MRKLLLLSVVLFASTCLLFSQTKVKVYVFSGQSNMGNIPTLTPEMETWMNEGNFLKGSMKPKVEAAVQFLKNGGRKAIIAHLNQLHTALEGNSGTHVVP